MATAPKMTTVQVAGRPLAAVAERVRRRLLWRVFYGWLLAVGIVLLLAACALWARYHYRSSQRVTPEVNDGTTVYYGRPGAMAKPPGGGDIFDRVATEANEGRVHLDTCPYRRATDEPMSFAEARGRRYPACSHCFEPREVVPPAPGLAAAATVVSLLCPLPLAAGAVGFVATTLRLPRCRNCGSRRVGAFCGNCGVKPISAPR